MSAFVFENGSLLVLFVGLYVNPGFLVVSGSISSQKQKAAHSLHNSDQLICIFNCSSPSS